MKKIYQVTITILLLCALNTVFAQSTDYFNYQAVIRSSDGVIMQNQEVWVQFSIENENGTEFFVEEQEVTSDAYGVINISVGGGTIIRGAWSDINWEDGLLLLVAIDYDKDGTIDLNGTNLISPVPKANFALKAKVADDLSYPLSDVATSGSYADLANKPQLTINGDRLGLEGSNEVLLPAAQKDSLIIEGTTLSIAGSNSVELPVGNGSGVVNDATTTGKGIVQLSGDLTGMADAPTIANGAVTNAKVATGIDAAKLADGSVSNTELQSLGNVTGDVQAQLDAKMNSSSLANVAISGDYADLVNKPINIDEDKTDDLLKADLVNDLTTGGVSLVLSAEQGKVLKDALDQKAASANVYTKIEADNLLTGKVNTEAGKGLSENDYTNAEKALVSGAEQTANKNVANGYAGLDANTKIDVSQLPAITINNVYTVGTQADMLALNAVQGDMAIRTDVSQNYVHNGGTSGNMTDWTELAFPNIEVTSVNGKTGDVVVGIADISTLQTVLDSKANSADLANVATSGSFADLTDVPGNIDTDATNDLLQSDVVNDLTTGGTTKVLSAEQGKVLKTSVDENASNIADNTTAISTNATGINQNTSDIALKEDAANKSTDGTFTDNSDVLFPTQKAVKTYVDEAVSLGVPDATATTKGKVLLAGDLTGTADAPTIADGVVTNGKVATGIDAAKLADGSVSNTEFQYLNGATGNVQTQITDNATGVAANAGNISTNTTAIAIKENAANKSTDGTFATNSDVLFPTEKAVKTYVDATVASGAPDATNTSKGKVQLAGDLTGTADAPAIAAGAVTDDKVAAGIDAAKLADGSVSNTQLEYLGNVTGDVQAQLDAKMNSSSLANVAISGDYADLVNKPINIDEDKTDDLLKADLVNDLTTGGVSLVLSAEQGKVLKDALDQKAAIANIYTKTETDNLLIGKVDTETGKGLSENDYSNAEKALVGGAEQKANKNVANGYAGLDANSKIDLSQLPAITINNVYTVGSESDMLALSAVQGDMAIRTDVSQNYVRNSGTNNDISDWTELAFPNIEVTSVNGKTGDVIIGIADISTLQTVLDSKANTADFSTVATSGSYNDLTDVPASIDTDATNDVLQSDIVNDLLTGGSAKVLSAEQGKVLKTSVDENATNSANNTVGIATNTTAIAQNASDITTKENTDNKSTDGTLATNSDVLFPTEKAVKTYVDATVASGAPDATTSTKGKIQLAGDLSGTADAPEIAGGAVTDTKLAAGIDAAKLADGSVSNTEFQYLNGVTSNVQTQIDANATSIATNASDISANATNIALNATKVALADTAGVLRSEINAANNIGTTLQSELDATQAGSGLETDGTYSANTSANYIGSASSLADADDALDAQVKTNADAGDVNAASIVTNSTNIATNATAIDLRATQSALEDTTTAVRSAVDANATSIVTNASDISANATNIALNATKVALADTAGVLRSEINAANNIGTTLQGELDATQAGSGLETDGTYSANTSANYIGSASSLADADDALDAQVKTNADAGDVNAASIVTNSTNIATNATAIDLRATQSALEDTTTAVRSAVDANATSIVTNASDISANATNIALNATKVALADTAGVLRSEINAANNIGTTLQGELDATQAGSGLETDGTYSANTSANYIGSASSLADADDALDAQVKTNADAGDVNAASIVTNSTNIATNATAIDLRATQSALEDTTTAVRSAVDANATSIVTNASDISANATNIALNATKVALADTAGVLRSEINAANNIGTTLQGELDATQAGSGLETDGTYSANTSANYIGSASSLADADDALDAQVKTNADAGDVNAASIVTNSTNIATNATAIDLRATQSALEDTTTAVRSAVDANATSIATNASDISANATNIALNATKVALADTAGVLRSEINAANNIGTTLQGELDATQAGSGLETDGTYSANTSANYIGSASSLADADDALDAQVKTNADAGDVNAASIVTNSTNIATNATAIDLRATQTALEDTTTAVRSAVDANATSIVTNASDISANATNIALNATKVALADTAGVLRSEINAANNIGTTLQGELDATQAGSGLETDGTYSANTSANYIGSASSLADADDALDAQVKTNADAGDVNAASIVTNSTNIATNATAIDLRATQTALEDTTTAVRSAVDANATSIATNSSDISANATNIALNATKVALADTAGVLRSEINAANNIGTTLQGELDATQAGSGLETDGTYSANTSANYIGSASSLAGADDALDAQLKVNADAIALRATQAALTDTATAIRGALVDSLAAVRADAFSVDNLTSAYVPYYDGTGLDDSPVTVRGTNVGIGINSPDANLHVYDGSSGYSFSSSTSGLIIEDSGDAYLYISGGSGNTGHIQFGDDNSPYAGKLEYDHSVNAMTFSTNGANERMRINSSGNVGIGTTSPTEKLDVVGDIKASVDVIAGNDVIASGKITTGEVATSNMDLVPFKQMNDSLAAASAATTADLTDTYVPYLNGTGLDDSPMKIAAGKVGIGTTDAPKEVLDVNGNINIAENSSLMIGDSTVLKLGSLITSTAVGVKASTSGNNTTSVGYHAGFNSASSYATLLGAEAGQNGSGSQFTGIGISAGANNNGPNSIAIGPYAGDSLTAASAVVIGYQAGQNNAGEASVAIGREAGKDNTGDNSIAIGPGAGTSNSGAGLVGLGIDAGKDNKAVALLAIGLNSGLRNKGLNLTAIGGRTGIDNTGEHVIGMGNGAIMGNDGDYVIALGYEAGRNNTLNNQFIVKQTPVNTTPLIQGDFATGNLNIAGKVTAGANATANMDLVPLKQMKDSLAAARADAFGVDNLTDTYVPYLNGTGLDDSPISVDNIGVGIDAGDFARSKLTVVNTNSVEDLTNPEEYQLSLVTNSISNGDKAGMAFAVTNSSGSTNNIGAAILHRRTDNQSKGTLEFYNKRTTSSGGSPQLTMSLTDAGNVEASGKVTAGANATANMDLVPLAQMNDSLAAAGSAITSKLDNTYIPYLSGTELRNSAIKQISSSEVNVVTEVVSTGKFYFDNYGGNPVLRLTRNRGTIASPLATTNGDLLGTLSFSGRTDAGQNQLGAMIKVTQTGDASTAYIPAKFSLFTADGPAYGERLTVLSDGKVGIGTTSPSERLDVAGNIKGSGTLTIDGNLAMGVGNYINADGDNEGLSFDADGNGTFSESLTVNKNTYFPSDRRLKTNIETLSDVLDKINQIRGVRFEYKDQTKYATGPKIGVIAQELQKVYPELVTEGADGFLKVDYTQLTGILLQAVKEQQKEIDILKQQMQRVMNKLEMGD